MMFRCEEKTGGYSRGGRQQTKSVSAKYRAQGFLYRYRTIHARAGQRKFADHIKQKNYAVLSPFGSGQPRLTEAVQGSRGSDAVHCWRRQASSTSSGSRENPGPEAPAVGQQSPVQPVMIIRTKRRRILSLKRGAA